MRGTFLKTEKEKQNKCVARSSTVKIRNEINNYLSSLVGWHECYLSVSFTPAFMCLIGSIVGSPSWIQSCSLVVAQTMFSVIDVVFNVMAKHLCVPNHSLFALFVKMFIALYQDWKTFNIYLSLRWFYPRLY